MAEPTIEKLIELWRITEMRDDSVYGTEYIEDQWVPHDAGAPKGYLYVPKSTSYQGQTMRRTHG